MANKLGWKAEPATPLPDGFELREDVDFVYLYEGDELLAKFSSRTTMEAIIDMCYRPRKVNLKEEN